MSRLSGGRCVCTTVAVCQRLIVVFLCLGLSGHALAAGELLRAYGDPNVESHAHFGAHPTNA
jgi:hypothetical protein